MAESRFMAVPHVLLICAAYLIGAIPFGLIVARVFAGVDVREAGSGNIGATNVARTSGKGLGILTLALDAAKGAWPVLVSERVLGLPLAVTVAAGLAAFVGHVFPAYLRFRGGKGVATALGVFLALTPVPTLVAVAAFAVTYLVSRIVSVGSLVAALALVGAVIGLDERREVIGLAAIVTSLVLVRHKGNIQRLIHGREHKI